MLLIRPNSQQSIPSKRLQVNKKAPPTPIPLFFVQPSITHHDCPLSHILPPSYSPNRACGSPSRSASRSVPSTSASTSASTCASPSPHLHPHDRALALLSARSTASRSRSARQSHESAKSQMRHFQASKTATPHGRRWPRQKRRVSTTWRCRTAGSATKEREPRWVSCWSSSSFPCWISSFAGPSSHSFFCSTVSTDVDADGDVDASAASVAVVAGTGFGNGGFGFDFDFDFDFGSDRRCAEM